MKTKLFPDLSWALPGVLCIALLNGCGHANITNAANTGGSGTGSNATSTTTGNDYYVSTSGSDISGNGSKGSPWATIANASKNVGSGAVVHVAAGVYTGSFDTNASGTSSAYVTYEASTADFSGTVNCAQIAANHGNLSACPQLVGNDDTTATWQNDGDYVAIQGFDVTGSGINGIYTQGNATKIIGNHVHDILTGTCNDNGGSGINLNGTNAQVIGNYVHNMGPYPSACGYVQGIYFLTTGGFAENNISFDNSGFGIQLWHNPQNITLSNNTIFNNASGGIVLGTDDAGVTVDYITVNSNIVTNNGGVGIEEQGGSESSTGIHNSYHNNLVYGNMSGGISLFNGLEPLATVLLAPDFMNPTGTSSGNYHLAAASPAIGTATSSDAPATDFDGNARPQNRKYDIGAYEYMSTASTSASTGGALQLSSTSVSFPETTVGSTSAIQYITLTNTGTTTVKFASNFAISGPFAFGGKGTCTMTVAPNASCTISLVFSPTSYGGATGAVTLTDNSGSDTQMIALSGWGS
jgi:Right handed beta helix region/Abnormal spindle-like microcephaly-assoc'd, ASPM-SPD-2-Hydin